LGTSKVGALDFMHIPYSISNSITALIPALFVIALNSFDCAVYKIYERKKFELNWLFIDSIEKVKLLILVVDKS